MTSLPDRIPVVEVAWFLTNALPTVARLDATIVDQALAVLKKRKVIQRGLWKWFDPEEASAAEDELFTPIAPTSDTVLEVFGNMEITAKCYRRSKRLENVAAQRSVLGRRGAVECF